MRAIITTVPFGEIDPTPRRILEDAGIEYTINPLNRKLRASEVPEIVSGFDIIIAGTETIGVEAMQSSALKAICRVGVGLDGVDLLEARRRGIAVSYTPDAPSPAVAELTIGLMLDLLRCVGRADRGLRAGRWDRHFGRRITESVIGVIGCGRVGGRVIKHLLGGFPGVQILAHDIRDDLRHSLDCRIKWVPLEALLREADVVTIHVPLTNLTRNLIGIREFALMKRDALLVNTARGGIVEECALVAALNECVIAAAAIDVFEEEPYSGPLAKLENALLTCHMGSMTRDCRIRMEVESTEEAVRFATSQPLLWPVPDSDYQISFTGQKSNSLR